MMENSILLNENSPFSEGVRKIYCGKVTRIFLLICFFVFEKQFSFIILRRDEGENGKEKERISRGGEGVEDSGEWREIEWGELLLPRSAEVGERIAGSRRKLI
jgi:hypothetical protein